MLRTRTSCRGCSSEDLVRFLELGLMPLAGGHLIHEQIPDEKKFPLNVHFCRQCTLVQILDVIDPEILFQNYQYISSVIPVLSEHFKQYAKEIHETYLPPNGSILEFGCNDGVLLEHFVGTSIKAYGIDPSKNISQRARTKGLEVITGYFDRAQANAFLKKYGKVDVVTGSNVFAHTDDIQEIIEAAKIIMKEESVFIVEIHYLKDLLDLNQYDTIYHEHLSYYSVTALKNIFTLADMKLVSVSRIPIHGGSIRVVAARANSERIPDKSVDIYLEEEKGITESRLHTFARFCSNHRNEINALLVDLKRKGNHIVGYGAPGRGTILLNYCNIGTALLDYVVDISPLRAGKLMPGVHVPIEHIQRIREDKPEYVLLLAWNYADSIMAQEKELHSDGTKFIVPFPSIHLL